MFASLALAMMLETANVSVPPVITDIKLYQIREDAGSVAMVGHFASLDACSAAAENLNDTVFKAELAAGKKIKLVCIDWG
jgi:hypothetical protein